MKLFLLVAFVVVLYAAVASASIPGDIAEHTKRYWHTSTRDGPGGGVEACAWAVNNIISNAGLRKIGANPDYVPSVVQALDGGRGRRISAHEAVPGDLAIACHQAHIGVCMSSGCGTIDSNSSSERCFCWDATYSFFTQYFGCEPAIYRVEH
jgi:hypothetical protein